MSPSQPMAVWLCDEGSTAAAIGRDEGAAGVRPRAVRDVPVCDIPPGYATERWLHQHGELDFCLLILAERT